MAFTAPQQVGGGALTNRAQSDLGLTELRQRRRWGRPHTPGRELTFSEARAGVYFKTTAPPPRRRHSGAAKAAAAVAAATGRRAGRGGGGGGGRHNRCRRRRRRRRAGGVGGGGGGRDGSFLRGRLRRQRCGCAPRRRQQCGCAPRRRHRSEARTIALRLSSVKFLCLRLLLSLAPLPLFSLRLKPRSRSFSPPIGTLQIRGPPLPSPHGSASPASLRRGSNGDQGQRAKSAGCKSTWASHSEASSVGGANLKPI